MWKCHHVGLRTAWPFITAPRHRDGTRQHGVCRCRNVGLCAAWTFIAKPCHRRITQHGIYHHSITRGVTIPSRGITPSIAGASARKGVGEATPKGLYRRQGRVDERSEIYPVLMNPIRTPTPWELYFFKFLAPFPH